MKKSIMGLLFAILPLAAGAQTIKLETSLVSREFDVSNHHLKTVGYKLAGDDHNFVYVSGENTDAPLKETIPACREFSLPDVDLHARHITQICIGIITEEHRKRYFLCFVHNTCSKDMFHVSRN